MANAWIEHVKQFSAKNNISFRNAMKHPYCRKSYQSIKGGALDGQNLFGLLSKSYDTNPQQQNLNDEYIVDKELSGRRVQVYHNPNTNQSVTVHRGTQGFKDVLTDAQLALGLKTNKRWKHAEKVQRQAESKYGTENMSTIGHSLGAAIAEKVGKKGKETITYNKPTTPWDLNKKVNHKQTDIRTSRDLVSILKPFRKGTNDVTIKSKSFNPLKEHSTAQLKKLGKSVFGS